MSPSRSSSQYAFQLLRQKNPSPEECKSGVCTDLFPSHASEADKATRRGLRGRGREGECGTKAWEQPAAVQDSLEGEGTVKRLPIHAPSPWRYIEGPPAARVCPLGNNVAPSPSSHFYLILQGVPSWRMFLLYDGGFHCI